MKAPTDLLGLIKWLRKRQPAAKVYAANALAKMGPEAAAAIPDLANLVNDEEVEVAVAAVRTLGRVGGDDAITALISGLNHRAKPVRREAVWALKGFGTLAQEAMPAFIEALHDPDMRVRLSATHALGQLGTAAEPAIADLIGLLKSTNLILCRLAAEALSRIGQPALAALTDQLQSYDAHVRREAAWAIRLIVPDLPSLERTLRSGQSADEDTAIPAPADAGATVSIDVEPQLKVG